MPIKGLTDRNESSFPKIGDIRKGEPKDAQGRMGKDLSYFRAAFVEGEEGAAALFAKMFGDEPRELYVMLPFRSIARNWEAWQEKHTAGQLWHRCDGETCVLWYDKDSGEYRQDPIPCPGGCVPVGRLKVIIPDLRRLAYVEVHTGSINDILEITRNLEALAQLTGNGVNGIPLVLKRRPREISQPRKDANGKVKRVRGVKHLLSIEAEPTWVELQIGSMRAAAMPGGYVAPQLAEQAESAGPSWNELIEDVGAPPVEPDEPEVEDADFVEEDSEPEQGPPPPVIDPPAQHWSETRDRNGVTLGDRLYAKATTEWGLDSEEFYTALGVMDIANFAGSASEAKAQILSWIAGQAEL